MSKATWPALFGIEKAQARCDELLNAGTAHLAVFGTDANPLNMLADYIVERAY